MLGGKAESEQPTAEVRQIRTPLLRLAASDDTSAGAACGPPGPTFGRPEGRPRPGRNEPYRAFIAEIDKQLSISRLRRSLFTPPPLRGPPPPQAGEIRSFGLGMGLRAGVLRER